jgi:hypothetical protein
VGRKNNEISRSGEGSSLKRISRRILGEENIQEKDPR